MKEIENNGITYVLIPKTEFEKGKFFNEHEKLQFKHKLNQLTREITEFKEGLNE